MNKFKALIADFDGTLVDSSLKISPIVEDSIKSLMTRGFLFSIATARPFQGIIEEVCRQLSLKSPVIVRAGSEIFDPIQKISIWAKYIPESEARHLIEYCLKIKQSISLERDREIYVFGKLPSKEYTSGLEIKDFQSLVKYDRISKIVLRGVKENALKEFKKTLSSTFKNLHIDISFNPQRKAVLDIVSGETSKKVALYEFAELVGIKPEEIVGVGDGYNDQQLLSACGYKVAMQNAPEELKKIANIIVGPAEENGIVEAIEKIFASSYGTKGS